MLGGLTVLLLLSPQAGNKPRQANRAKAAKSWWVTLGCNVAMTTNLPNAAGFDPVLSPGRVGHSVKTHADKGIT